MHFVQAEIFLSGNPLTKFYKENGEADDEWLGDQDNHGHQQTVGHELYDVGFDVWSGR